MISTNWQSQIFKKKIVGPNLGPMGLNQAQNEVFCLFLEFGSEVFPEIEYDDIEILQLRAKFQTAMVSCSRFIWIRNSSDHRRV